MYSISWLGASSQTQSFLDQFTRFPDQTSSYRVPALMLLPLHPTGSAIQLFNDRILLHIVTADDETLYRAIMFTNVVNGLSKLKSKLTYDFNRMDTKLKSNERCFKATVFRCSPFAQSSLSLSLKSILIGQICTLYDLKKSWKIIYNR